MLDILRCVGPHSWQPLGLLARRRMPVSLAPTLGCERPRAASVEILGGLVAFCCLFLGLSPLWPHHPLVIYLPAAPWSAIRPSPTCAPTSGQGWPQTSTPRRCAWRAPVGTWLPH